MIRPIIWLATRHPALGLVERRARSRRGGHGGQEAVAQHPVPAPARGCSAPRRAARPACSGRPRRREERRQQPLARRRRAPPASDRPDHLARVDGQLEGRDEQVVLGAEVVVHQRRVDPGGLATPRIVVPPKPCAANWSRAAARIAARVSGAPGRRPRLDGRRSRRRPPGSARARTPATRAGRARAPRRLRALAGVDLDHDRRRRSRRSPRARGSPSAPIDPRPGHQVLVLGRAGAVGEVDVPQPVAEPVGHRDRVGLRRSRRGTGRSWCWRRPRRRGPSPAGTSPSRAVEDARHGYMFSTANAIPVDSSSAAMPVDEAARRSPSASGTAGVRRPPRRRPPRPSRRSARACPTARCPRPAA